MAKRGDEFEKNLERLRRIVADLERGELSLESGVALFKEGLGLAKACSVQLARARSEVTVVAEGLIKEFEAFQSEETGAEETGATAPGRGEGTS